MGLKAQIVKDGEDYVLLLPDDLCKELNLNVGDTMIVNYSKEEGLCLRKVDVREEWPDQ